MMKVVTKPKSEGDTFIQELIPRRQFKREITARFSAGAAATGNHKTILNPDQLRHCANAVTNDGILCALLNKLIYSIKGERPKFVVDLNEELTEFATEEEIIKLKKDILETEFADTIKETKQDTIRANKRCSFNERLDSLLFSTFTFGRNLLEIIRFPPDSTWKTYGQPRALKVLNSQKIQDVITNTTTGELEAIIYDDGNPLGPKVIQSTNMIPAFYNNHNLYDNTDFSGMSLVWPVLSISQTNTVINDEDIPESVKRTWAKFGFIFAGTSKKSVLKKIREVVESSTYLVHNQKDLVAQVVDIGRDMMELPNVRTANAKYMAWCLMMPLFLMFEDDANFATAAQAVQAFKVGVVDYYRTWIRGFLEKYWYDPILADHLGVTVEEVIAEPIKIKATFEDLNYAPFADKVTSFVSLKNAGIYDDEKILKELDAPDVWERKQKQLETEALNQAKSIITTMSQKLAQANALQTQQNPPKVPVKVNKSVKKPIGS